MKTIIKNIFIAVLLISLTLPCLAAAESGKITVTLEDKDKNIINGLEVYFCQIAELNSTGYHLTNAFENSGISISGIVNTPNEMTAKTIADYIKSNNVSAKSVISENGKAVVSDLNLGIWIVYPQENSKYTFNPYIVFLPFESNGKLYYEISSSPKVEDSNLNEMNIYVVKKWDDRNNASKKRPDSVTVELLENDIVVTEAVLSEANGWTHTFTKLSKNGNYSVREKAVADYKASYSGDFQNGFIVTNTYVGEKLPQTGQYWWPIVIIAIAGIGFVLLGIFELGAKKNGKKK